MVQIVCFTPYSKSKINYDTKKSVDQLLAKYTNILNIQKLQKKELSKITGIKAKLTLKESAKPIFLKARQVPFTLKPLIEKELDLLEKEGILEKTNTTDYATPIVQVLKSDGTVCICGDFSVTLNKNLVVHEHPLPTTDELFANMAGGRYFSKRFTKGLFTNGTRGARMHLLFANGTCNMHVLHVSSSSLGSMYGFTNFVGVRFSWSTS